MLHQHLPAVRAMLVQRRFELDQQVFRDVRRETAALQPGHQVALPLHMPLAEGDMIVHHLKIGGGEGHLRKIALAAHEVVRNLALRDHEKGLSTGEKQMYVKAKKILASELMYAKDLTEDDAHTWLEEVLANPAKGKRAKAKPKTAATATA